MCNFYYIFYCFTLMLMYIYVNEIFSTFYISFKSGKNRYFISRSYVVPHVRAGNKVISYIPLLTGFRLIKWRFKNKGILFLFCHITYRRSIAEREIIYYFMTRCSKVATFNKRVIK